MTPHIRRPLGILAVLVGILAYALFAVWLFEPVSTLHPLLQLPIWAVLGVAWVFPLKPVMIWIETGRWRP
ncbi:DUF2842 domain-containing protein [Sandaracinobacter sp. RS1-74]|uniref:DUF2842 domain-containing protein n=1 Tax=Sandaracinobacteroides sayramensis TaxID=2913411 RepID=UPI001EDC5643|nr:DUF2842 domain-containing protein [Sandaracinobacteroides sayramensis]MCG2842413.1 DUF2842 domain-containing protein [Sandaracinobacteroides sayramensis]